MVDRLLSCGGRATFRALTEGCTDRIEVAVAFLAVLDLYKSEHVEVSQPVSFGELVVELAPGGTGTVGSSDRALAQRSQGDGERQPAGGRGSSVVQVNR
jgi:hypothetical protein